MQTIRRRTGARLPVQESFRPRRILAVELGRPIAPIEPENGPDGRQWPAAALLVRLHGWPLGFIDVDLADGALGAEGICAAVTAALGDAIGSHLRSDGFADLETASPDGLPTPDDVACLRERRAFLAAAEPVTVVVPVADRPDLLERCLGDLAGQDHPAFDIVVVDNAPGRSGARPVVDAWQARHPTRSLRCIDQARPGSSIARNTGLAAATTEITAFVDADVDIDAWWLTELVRPIAADPRVGCSTGLILPADLATPAQSWLMEWGGYGKGFAPRVFDLDERNAGPLYPYQPGLFGSGQSMAFRTALLRRLGGFDLALGVRTASQGGEELAAFLDVVLSGARLAYVPSAIVWHPDPAAEDVFIAKLESYAVGLTALMARMVAKRPSTAWAILRRLPAAVRYFFSGGSPKNRRRSATFPRWRVLRAELRGMAVGPFGYVLSRARLRRR